MDNKLFNELNHLLTKCSVNTEAEEERIKELKLLLSEENTDKNEKKDT